MKRSSTTAGIDTQPPPKRQKVSNPSITSNGMKQLLQLFKHFESQNIQNQTLDRCIYDCYISLSKTLNKGNQTQQITDKFLSKIREIMTKKTTIPCNLFIEQLIELKAQIKAIRLLSRDIGLSSSIADLSHGVNNVHSWQRPYIDPLRTQNPSVCKHSKYDLESAKYEDIDVLIDSSPQTIEELVYQCEYDGMKKLVHRRRMLNNYITHCESNKNYMKMYKKSKEEMQLLHLCELQNKVRNEIIHCRMDTTIYDQDNQENEALLNPDLFARTAQIGLQFDPHINSANHPPTMATSKEVFPFYYVGEK